MEYKIKPCEVNGVKLDIPEMMQVYKHYRREMTSEYVVDNILKSYDGSQEFALRCFAETIVEFEDDGFDEEKAIKEAISLYNSQSHSFGPKLEFKEPFIETP